MSKSFFKNTIATLFCVVALSSFLFADTTYTVEKGDTLYSISKKYQITVAELRAANNLSENDVLKADQKLIIPTADIGTAAALSSDKNQKNSDSEKIKTSDYIVQKGDTLYGIARKNGITVPQLLAINGLDSSAVIKVGQKLKIKDNGTSEIKTTVKPVEAPKTTAKTEIAEKKETPVKKEDATEIPDTRTYGITINSDSSVVWPVKNPVVTQVKGKVSGVQLTAKEKESVKCIHEGTVMFVGVYRGFGQVLFVQSKTGLIYAYTGLDSVKVKKGDYVVSGADLGIVGVDSITKKPQITFMVFQNGQPIDPAKAPRN